MSESKRVEITPLDMWFVAEDDGGGPGVMLEDPIDEETVFIPLFVIPVVLEYLHAIYYEHFDIQALVTPGSIQGVDTDDSKGTEGEDGEPA